MTTEPTDPTTDEIDTALDELTNHTPESDASDDDRDDDDPDEDEDLQQMFAAHRAVGKAAMDKALEAINMTPASDIPINVAVQLLKFGADLERKAALGIDPDEDDDPFGAIAGALNN